jgi:hypothetical protein
MSSREESIKAIEDIWVSLGRDKEKLKLEGKTDEELVSGVRKLKAIEMSVKLLCKPEGNHALAVHLLANIFKDDEDDE